MTEANRPTENQVNPYVERWEQALRVLETMSEHERTKHFDMGTWGRQTPCGTVACLAGHCSLDPWFRERGFIGRIETEIDSSLIFTGPAPRAFFGERGYSSIFLTDNYKYESVVNAVRAHIEYLKAGGDPNAVEYGDDDYWDDGYDDYDYDDDPEEIL